MATVLRAARRALCCGLVCVALATTAGSATATVARQPLAESGTFLVSQLEFPPQLVVRGELVEVGYDAQRRADATTIPKATGTLYVRHGSRGRYTAVPLTVREALVKPSNADTRRLLRALVPQRLLVRGKLTYYAVIRDPRTGRTVTVPDRGARQPETLWVINGAFRVDLGRHAFDRTREPDEIVARADPDEVGFNDCPDAPGSCGQPFGPWSFEVADDRSTWLFDYLGLTPDLTAGQILAWAPGQPDTVERTLQLPFGPEGWNRGTEFALGLEGSVYVIRGGPPSPVDLGQRLTRLAASGQELWTSRLPGCCGFNTQLRTGPDGTVYWTTLKESARDFSNWMARWVPVATPDGRPLPPAAQERGTRWTQPLPGGLQLVKVSTGWRDTPGLGFTPHEARLAVVDRAGRLVRAWRVRSPTIIWWYGDVTPALVDADPVIVLTATAPPAASIQAVEYLVLRLGPRGELRSRFSLPYDDPPRTPFGRFAITELRVEPDGNVYQLGSSPDFGVAIYRYSLAPSGG